MDGDPRLLDDLSRLVEVEPAERVFSAREDHHRLAALDPGHALDRVRERVEQVRFAVGRDSQSLQRVVDLHAVLGEVGEDLGPEIVGDHRHPVFGPERLDESVGRGQRLVPGLRPVLLPAVAELDQKRDGRRRLRLPDADDLLGNAVLEDLEIPGRDVRDELSLVVENRDVDRDDVRVGRE